MKILTLPQFPLEESLGVLPVCVGGGGGGGSSCLGSSSFQGLERCLLEKGKLAFSCLL